MLGNLDGDSDVSEEELLALDDYICQQIAVYDASPRVLLVWIKLIL